jgi:hypothetical protein
VLGLPSWRFTQKLREAHAITPLPSVPLITPRCPVHVLPLNSNDSPSPLVIQKVLLAHDTPCTDVYKPAGVLTV